MWATSTTLEQVKIMTLNSANNFTADLSLQGWSLATGLKYMCFVTKMNLGTYDLGYDLSLSEIRTGVFKVNVMTKRMDISPNTPVQHTGNISGTLYAGVNTVKYSVCHSASWGGYSSNNNSWISLSINGASIYNIGHPSFCVKSLVQKKSHGTTDSIAYSMSASSGGSCYIKLTQWELATTIDSDCEIVILFIKGKG